MTSTKRIPVSACSMLPGDGADSDQGDLATVDGAPVSPAKRKSSLASGKSASKAPSADPDAVFKSQLIGRHRECINRFGHELAMQFGPLGDTELSQEDLAAVAAYLTQVEARHHSEIEALTEKHAVELSTVEQEHRQRFELATGHMRLRLSQAEDKASMLGSELAAVRGRAVLMLDDD